MMPDAGGTAAIDEPQAQPSRAWLVLVGLTLLFVVLRLPVIQRQIPAQDEDYFAVPGWTILEDGVPRIPYMPVRDPESAFYRTDEILFALPPLYFYWEAFFYGLLGPSTPVARFSSLVAGVIATWILYRLGRVFLTDGRAACWAAGLYLFSRIVYFPAVMTRPDMLCGALGLAAILATWRYTQTQRLSLAVVSGLLVGLGGLTHPFALVFGMQCGVWILLAGGTWLRRLLAAVLYSLAGAAMVALWLPLILKAPDAFQAQFFNNVLGRAGPGLTSRLLWPWESIAAQVPLFFEHAGPIQAALMLLGAVGVAVIAWRTRDAGLRTLALLIWSGIYLHMACQGTHPTKGYWCYTGALMFLGVGVVIREGLRLLESRPVMVRRVAASMMGIVLAGLLVPGGGLRTVAAHLQHWSDINYDAPRFTQQLLEELPQHGEFVVDPGYVFEFYLSGRSTVLALNFPFFFDVTGRPYDVLVAGPYSIRDGVPDALGAQFVRSYGDREDLFACFAELYRAPQTDILPAPTGDASSP